VIHKHAYKIPAGARFFNAAQSGDALTTWQKAAQKSASKWAGKSASK
jgi:hypothetical protein